MMPVPVKRMLTVWCLSLFLASAAPAADLGDSVLRDYPLALTLPEKRVELSLDYGMMPDSLVQGESDKTAGNAAYLATAFSDSGVFSLGLNYGLFDRTTLRAAMDYRSLDYAGDDVGVFSFDFAIKQNLLDRPYGWIPMVAVDAGLRTDYADDLAFHDQIDDKTLFLRLTGGKIFGNFFPNYFLEYGYTDIDAQLRKDAGPAPAGVTLGLDRTENYLKGGFCMLWKYPYSAIARLEYQYIRLLRDDNAGGASANHILMGDLNWFASQRVILNIGAKYYKRALVGEVPLLYHGNDGRISNRECVEIHAGLTFLFEGAPAPSGD